LIRQFLRLPDEILVTRHARPPEVFRRGKEERGTGSALPGGDQCRQGFQGIIRAGHERVLRARFADAQFFWQSDQKCRLADYLPKLERVIYESRLGSYRDKVERIRAIARWLTEQWFNLACSTPTSRRPPRR